MRRAVLITATVVALGLAACGDDDNDSSAATTASTTAAVAARDVDRYCALTRELDAAGEKFFSGLGRDASEQEFEDAERRFIERSAAKLDELQRVAPPQIEDDVATLLAGQRERAGLQAAAQVDESEASAAEKRVRAFERRSCGA